MILLPSFREFLQTIHNEILKTFSDDKKVPKLQGRALGQKLFCSAALNNGILKTFGNGKKVP